MVSDDTGPDWFTIFRTDVTTASWLYRELIEERLRQGWGAPGFALQSPDGKRVAKAQWEAAHLKHWGHAPSPQRFAILSRMLDLDDGDVVVVPKMPGTHQFTVARVSGRYRFEADCDREDFRHIVPLHRDSVRTFSYRADDDAFLVSGLFARANHRSAVTFCEGAEHVKAVYKLLGRPSSTTSRSHEELSRAAIDTAFKAAATKLHREVEGWNGLRFERAVRQAFRDQGYTVKDHRRFNREGADVDILVSPPASPFGLFLPSEIAVQAKWKQGIDHSDVDAIGQVVQWVEWTGSDAVKLVISSASEFTQTARNLANEKEVVLIGGLQTMCFLLGIPDRYRDDWD